MATYIIGDVHGCFQSLMGLLEHIEFDAALDALWLTGDLVNRGPASLEMLRWAFANRAYVDCVLGNHDLHMMAVWAGRRAQQRDPGFVLGEYQGLHRGDTFDEVLQAPDCDELLGWLKGRPLIQVWHAQGVALVHAALLAQWSIADAVGYASEVQAALGAGDAAEFLRAMYGNEPNRWSDELRGHDRLRVIINAMTRLRVLRPDHSLAFDFSGTLPTMPPDRIAWFDAPNPRWATHTVVFGHWSAIGVHRGAHVIGLDSGCVWGGTLSALRLEDRVIFAVPCAP